MDCRYQWCKNRDEHRNFIKSKKVSNGSIRGINYYDKFNKTFKMD